MNSIIEHKADTREFKSVINLWPSVMPVVVIRPYLKWEHIGATEAFKNDPKNAERADFFAAGYSAAQRKAVDED